ncbi:hypothetical protein ACS0TY_030008 [Phlomoides rotata]
MVAFVATIPEGIHLHSKLSDRATTGQAYKRMKSHSPGPAINVRSSCQTFSAHHMSWSLSTVPDLLPTEGSTSLVFNSPTSRGSVKYIVVAIDYFMIRVIFCIKLCA